MPATTRKRRRTRFTVTYMSGKREVVLAFDATDAHRWGAERGHVQDVTYGDYRQAARDAQLREHNAQRMAQAEPNGYRVLDAALEAAKEHLGLKLPVEIVQTHAAGGRNGAYNFRPVAGKFYKDPRFDTACGMKHYITIKWWLSAEQASRTLWHELAHAMQTERAIERCGARTEREMFEARRADRELDRGVGYMDKAREREAREMSVWAETHPLCEAR